MLERKPAELVAAALASKVARIAWRLMIFGRFCSRSPAAVPA
jgi:hypothetical protein